MPITKVQFRPGINKEVTVYANEGGWVSCNNVRFRSGYPEKIGGWSNYSPGNTFFGVARSLYTWADYNTDILTAFGTNQRYYVEFNGTYNDITPNDAYQTSYLGVTTPNALTNTAFATTSGSQLVTVTDASLASIADLIVGTEVLFTLAGGAGITVGGAVIIPAGSNTASYEIITIPSSTTFTIIVSANAGSSTTGGNSSATATYKIPAGNAIASASAGWGSGGFGLGGFGASSSGYTPLRIWSQANFNQDLVMAIRAGGIYYWQNSYQSSATWTPAITIAQYANTQTKSTQTNVSWTGTVSQINVTSTAYIDNGAYVSGPGITVGTYVVSTAVGGTLVTLSAATTGTQTNVTLTFSYSGQTAPTETFQIISSDTTGFVVAMGATPYNPLQGSYSQPFNPLLVRWSDQSVAADWSITTSNQAGSQTLTNGSYIVGAVNTRQEILIWTDQALYSMQYIGPPYVFGFTPLMDNISIISQNAMITVNGVTYWMGVDKFYVYSGMVNTLPCTLRKFIFTNINLTQALQIVAGHNEPFNEVWWVYPSINSNVNDSYVIYNYIENTWYYGSINRTFFYQNSLKPFPMGIYSSKLSYLSAGINSSQMNIALIDPSTYPISGTLIIDTEQISYANISGNNLAGVVRGVNGTTAAAHAAYAPVYPLVPNQLVYHENYIDDNTPSTGPIAINSVLQSADFAIGDGHHYAQVWRCLPDFIFNTSTSSNPVIYLTVYPRESTGTSYSSSVTNPDQMSVTSSSTSPVELFTSQIYTRVRGRQMALQISSPNLGVFWQLGALRFDIRPDGRR